MKQPIPARLVTAFLSDRFGRGSSRWLGLFSGVTAVWVFGLVLSGAEPAIAKEDRPPNFVVVFTDDQGYQDVGVFGSPDIETPDRR